MTTSLLELLIAAKNLRPRSVGSQKKFGYKTIVRSQKVQAQKIKIKKNKSNKTLGQEKFGVQTFFESNKF